METKTKVQVQLSARRWRAMACSLLSGSKSARREPHTLSSAISVVPCPRFSSKSPQTCPRPPPHLLQYIYEQNSHSYALPGHHVGRQASVEVKGTSGWRGHERAGRSASRPEKAPARHKRHNLRAFVNLNMQQQRHPLPSEDETTLNEGDNISIVPSIAGGAVSFDADQHNAPLGLLPLLFLIEQLSARIAGSNKKTIVGSQHRNLSTTKGTKVHERNINEDAIATPARTSSNAQQKQDNQLLAQDLIMPKDRHGRPAEAESRARALYRHRSRASWWACTWPPQGSWSCEISMWWTTPTCSVRINHSTSRHKAQRIRKSHRQAERHQSPFSNIPNLRHPAEPVRMPWNSFSEFDTIADGTDNFPTRYTP